MTPRPTAASSARPALLQRLRLRWFVLSITVAGILCFLALALFDRRAAPIALAGSLLIALKGLGWLLALRHYRHRLRGHGFRW